MASERSEALPKMQYRFLGSSGLKVSAISLGGWLTYGGHVDNELAQSCLKAAYDAGINFFDCAEGYGGGESERVMGEAIKKFEWKRNDIVVSTKIYWGAANGELNVNNGGLSRKHIIEGTKASLQRLQLDYVDILYCHRPDRHTPILETVRAMNYIINSGQAFYWGTSMWSADEITRATELAEKHNLIGPIVEQPLYNAFDRERVESEYFHLYKEYGYGLTVFSPLKGGVLTGKYDDGIPEDSRIAKSEDKYIKGLRKEVKTEQWKVTIEKVKKLKVVADKLDTDRAALSMAWVLKNPNVSSAITGASRPEQIGKTVRALGVLPKLTDEIMKEIDEILGSKPEPIVMRFFDDHGR
ncbi:voltage-gated potassium channel subunit beta-2 [Pseudovirgaria hyperparasitica]|uniref:Voltage-gated potassium channel subunit beta-2 n=1 Tax=Pseudovirgaria hyperparasitica TaxID=470096 RepID=A0A6A6WBP3_9PEZI|nr:voltage-gated potassium channel subunit beta-2 [Pseudovirgaria hyperparasitica]KAF2758531.1 voltage-gated potassium channel subunit beta-2 [Pseudovirgaria hyperparasitica]